MRRRPRPSRCGTTHQPLAGDPDFLDKIRLTDQIKPALRGLHAANSALSETRESHSECRRREAPPVPRVSRAIPYSSHTLLAWSNRRGKSQTDPPRAPELAEALQRRPPTRSERGSRSLRRLAPPRHGRGSRRVAPSFLFASPSRPHPRCGPPPLRPQTSHQPKPGFHQAPRSQCMTQSSPPPPYSRLPPAATPDLLPHPWGSQLKTNFRDVGSAQAQAPTQPHSRTHHNPSVPLAERSAPREAMTRRRRPAWVVFNISFRVEKESSGNLPPSPSCRGVPEPSFHFPASAPPRAPTRCAQATPVLPRTQEHTSCKLPLRELPALLPAPQGGGRPPPPRPSLPWSPPRGA
nr:extensin-like [Camelus dromedarius]